MEEIFPWGEVMERFTYDFDGESLEVTKYFPWKRQGCSVLSGQPDKSKVQYHCEELHEASESLQYILISWIAHKNLGLNQHTLVAGIAKALGVDA